MTSQNHNYPTRMHEVLGVETGEEFELDTCTQGEKPRFRLDENGIMWRLSVYDQENRAKAGHLTMAINFPERIIRKPRLSEEQVKQLRACIEWFDQQTIQEMCSELGREIGYLDDVIAMLEKLEVEG